MIVSHDGANLNREALARFPFFAKSSTNFDRKRRLAFAKSRGAATPCFR
jgi:hypothetical protein